MAQTLALNAVLLGLEGIESARAAGTGPVQQTAVMALNHGLARAHVRASSKTDTPGASARDANVERVS